MDQQGNLKVSVGKHHRNVSKMPANLIAAFSVFRIVCLNLYYTAIVCQQKVMRGFQVIEAHVLIAAHVHFVHLLLGHLVILLFLLLGMEQRRRGKTQAENGHNQPMFLMITHLFCPFLLTGLRTPVSAPNSIPAFLLD
jgi:hypothetical protein